MLRHSDFNIPEPDLFDPVDAKGPDTEYEPNFPEGTKIQLVQYDPSTGKFIKYPEEIVRKNSKPPNEE